MKNRANWAKTLAVFSHPNHELAILCFLKRIQPRLIFLTDGGGPQRVKQTVRSLESIGLLEQARFLNYSEKSFYRALLDGNIGFYREVVSAVREACDGFGPEQVLCDAVEFYNPVHDMTLPIIRAALNDPVERKIYEVPLVRQMAAEPESYELQRMSPSRRNDEIHIDLTPDEHDFKTHAWENIYTGLMIQMRDLVCEIPDKEVFATSKLHLPEPGEDCVLRYEWRAQLLLERGEIERTITYEQHYLPIAKPLFSGGLNELHN